MADEVLNKEETIKQKVKKFFKDKDRKLLEKYGIVDPDSSVGFENGLCLEDLTEEGEEIVSALLYTTVRPKLLEVLRKIKKEEDEEEDGSSVKKKKSAKK